MVHSGRTWPYSVVVVLAVLMLVVANTGSAGAQVTSVGGGAFGIHVKGPVSAGPTPSVTLPAAGGGPITASTVGANVPRVLNVGALKVSTRGARLNTSGGFAESSASASALSIAAGLVSADQLTSQCRSGGGGSMGSVSMVGLRVAGARVQSVAPETVIDVPDVARVVVNQQVRADAQALTSITVNALHVTLFGNSAGPGTEFIVAQSRCSASGPEINAAPCPCSLWSPSTRPSVVDAGDPGADVELGVKVRVDRPGLAKGIRYYKSASNVGPHTGSLWSASGERLATVAFTNESNSGWQQAMFATPVALDAGTTYIASYHTTAGHYSFDGGYFAFAGLDRGPLHALANDSDGPNGVYTYGPSAFPVSGNGGANYWVDLIFE